MISFHKQSNNEFTKSGTRSVLIVSVIVVLLWYGATSVLNLIEPLFLPSPQSVINAFYILIVKNSFLLDVVSTTGRVLIAFIISIIIAFPVAVVVNKSKKFQDVFVPYIDFIRYIPVPVLIPLSILFFGLGELSKISILIFGTVFQLTLLFIEDLQSIPQEYSELAFTLHFSKIKILKNEILSALPSFYTNARISLALCWSYVVIAELVSANTGIGHMIKESQRFSNTANIYAAIITMACIGFTSDYLLRKGYYYLFPYKK